MIAVDTNVVSELMKLQPAEGVVRWASSLPHGGICIPTVAAAEFFHGVERLPEGARKSGLERALDAFVRRLGKSGMLPFDERAALEFGRVMGARGRGGRPISVMDALIAATCRSHEADLATRNTRDFEGLGITLINPWDDGQARR